MWFFEKRRISRLIDKVFDREFNLQRLAEFRQTVETQLQGKRGIVLSNYQKTFNAKRDHQEQIEQLRSMPTDDIVDGWFFLTLSAGHIFAMVHALVDRCLENPFPVLYKLFPDYPRDANDSYYAYSLAFLAVLHKKAENTNFTMPWLPAWLKKPSSADRSLQAALEILMSRCLTQFRDDEPRKLTLLCYAAVRRILKRLAVLQESEWTFAEQRFAFMRYFTEEISWNAFVSSPAGFVLEAINSRSMTISSRLIASFKNEKGILQVETGKSKLRELWDLEARLIQAAPNYLALFRERNLGETYPTEAIDVRIDYLGHLSLCLLESLPDWKAYALEHHKSDIAALAPQGSWQATKWLGPKFPTIAPTEQELADRFFFGDIGALRSLSVGSLYELVHDAACY